MIPEIETANMQSWAALETQMRSGWYLRISGRYSRRANSVYTHRYTGNNPQADVSYCEAAYNAKDLPTIFRLTDATQPDNLEAVLEERGYTKEAPSIVKAIDLSDRDFQSHPEFSFSQTFEESWLDDYMQFNSVNPNLYEAHKAIITRMPDVYYGRIADAALGIAVKTGEWVSFYDIVVQPDKRGQGYGKHLMHSLLKQSQLAGAKQGVLSVESTNTPAVSLYNGIGFKTAYSYWYYRQGNSQVARS